MEVTNNEVFILTNIQFFKKYTIEKDNLDIEVSNDLFLIYKNYKNYSNCLLLDNKSKGFIVINTFILIKVLCY